MKSAAVKPLVDFDLLTDREREVAYRLAMGASSKSVAEELRISQKTVDTHRGKVMAKLKVGNNAQLAREAIRSGFTQIDLVGGKWVK